MRVGSAHHLALIELLQMQARYLRAAGWQQVGSEWTGGLIAGRKGVISQRDAVSMQTAKDRRDVISMGGVDYFAHPW